MHHGSRDFWFPAKRYGWGWGLANCWQGLLVQAGYLALIIAGAKLLLGRGQQGLYWSLFAVLTILFIAVHWWKGEKLGWRSGS